MKNFSRLVLAAFGFAIILYLTACEPETVAPQVVTAQDASSQNNDLTLSLHQYLLVKRNSHTVEYNSYNWIKKVTNNANSYVTYDWNWEDSKLYLTAETFINNSLVKKVIYSLNDKRKSTESSTHHYSNGALVKVESHRYLYDANGKLKKIYATYNPQEKTEFFYASTGNLTKITITDVNGNPLKTINYEYINREVRVPKTDYYRFNPELDNLDFYLRIFGKFSDKLPQRIRVNNHNNQAVINTFYRYEFTPGGYVKNRKAYNVANNQYLYTVNYDYKVVKIEAQ